MPTFAVTGSGGLSLTGFWEEHRLQAYEGVSVPGFPNFFSVMGPYGYVGSSYFALIEAQTHHIVRCLKRARQRDATRVEVTEEANARYFAEMMSRRHRQVFWQDSCRAANSYYFDKNGDVALRPATTFEVYWRSRRFDPRRLPIHRLAPRGLANAGGRLPAVCKCAARQQVQRSGSSAPRRLAARRR